MRAFKTVNDSYIEPISFTVPRRAEVFQADIYPPATGLKPGVSAKDWLAGQDGMPPKIDLESVYDGSAPVEVPSDYKPPAAAPIPSPTKAAEPKREVEAAPAPTIRSPPPTMAEQKGSIAAMASKYQDNEPTNEESDDDASSFEEVSRPVQRSTAPPPKAETKLPSPVKITPTQISPAKPSPGPTPVSTVKAAESSPSIERAPNSSSASGNGSVESSLEQIKQLLEAQTRTITEQSQKIGQLASEVDTLKRKVGGGSSAGDDQSERIRQLELELEEFRS